MSKIRAAIIGTGGIARQHVRGLRAHSNRTELVAVVDIDHARAAAFAAEHGVPSVFTDAARCLTEIKPDLVHICTPPGLHARLAVMAMEAGANVLCEKPLCASLAEVDLIQAAAKRANRFCASVFQFRHGSSVAHFRAAMAANTLGRPLVAVCHTLWYRNAAYYEVPWRGKWSNELGGPTVGHGIHAMDQLLYLLGDWRQLRAIARTLDRPIEVEDVSAALVDFENGCVASIVNSILSPRQETYLRMDFQLATVELRHLYGYGNDNWRFSVPEGASPDPIKALSSLPPNVSADHTAQIGAILDDIANGTVPVTAGIEARRTIELLTAIYKSSFTGRPVDRGSIVVGDPFYSRFNGA